MAGKDDTSDATAVEVDSAGVGAAMGRKSRKWNGLPAGNSFRLVNREEVPKPSVVKENPGGIAREC